MKTITLNIGIRLGLVLAISLILSHAGLDLSILVTMAALVVILAMLGLFFSPDLNKENPKAYRPIKLASYLAYGFLLYRTELYWYFLPAILYDLNLKERRAAWVLGLFFIYGLFLGLDPMVLVAGLIFSGLGAMLYTALESLAQVEMDSFKEIDDLRLINSQIKEKQRDLIRIQDSALKQTRDAERKRITGEIHDSLGHSLSASIIQLAALEYSTQEDRTRKQLEEIRQVLTSGMDSVRTAIHNEQDESIDLKARLEKYIGDFKKAPVSFSYHAQALPKGQVKQSILNIVKEALTNINKHSNATRVQVSFQETRTDWILLISDNGSQSNMGPSQSGIGLLNMEERVLNLGGTINITDDRGFRIFIRLPKEGNI